MKIRGFTFIEIVVTLMVIGVALVTLSALISRDMKTSTQNRWDEIAQAAVTSDLEYYARVGGFNSLTPSDNPTIVDQPTNPPELQTIPWRQIRRYVTKYTGYPNQGYNPNPEVLLLTVCLDTAESAAAAAQGMIRTWKATTLVVKNGFDKSG